MQRHRKRLPRYDRNAGFVILGLVIVVAVFAGWLIAFALNRLLVLAAIMDAY